MSAPQLIVREVLLYERDVHLRMPFRFGVVTLTQAPQCFVCVRIEFADGRSRWGAAAELLAPKWFDKNLCLLYTSSAWPTICLHKIDAERYRQMDVRQALDDLTRTVIR